MEKMRAQALSLSSWRRAFSNAVIEPTNLVRSVWGAPNERCPRDVRVGRTDVCFVALALAFPWSTTVATGLVLLSLIFIVFTYRPDEIIDGLKRPACALPVLLVGLAAVGTAWADGVPWTDRLHAFGKASKLVCFLPFFVHFQNTSRARLIFAAYLISNLLLLLLSFVVFCSPDISSFIGAKSPGVPLKNYLDQTQGFAFIAVICVALAIEALRHQRRRQAIALAAIAVAFFANLAFVNIARTAFIYLPVMLALVTIRYARGWPSLAVLATVCVLGVGAWGVSPNLQFKMARLLGEVDAYQTNTMVVGGLETGGAERLEFWRKSIGVIRSAPIVGHGTGSTKELFANEAAGQTGIRAKIVDNPHNQTLAVAIQWGAIGCIVLYAMWGAHLLLFKEGFSRRKGSLLAWIGLLAVAQNFVSSVLNSHLFDFYQGWLYVIAVAIIGGQLEPKGSPDRTDIKAAPTALSVVEGR
ncbi:O-antigen ligase family protein [Bradyrhizobium sp. USDA 4506]